MPNPQFLQHHSKYIENVMEHGFIRDLCAELLTRPVPELANVLRAEVDHAGVDIVLSVGRLMHHIQLKTRSNKVTSDDYNISEELWLEKSGCVIWMIYDPQKMAPKHYYLMGCPMPVVDAFKRSPRKGYRHVRVHSANHKKLSIVQLAQTLFPVVRRRS